MKISWKGLPGFFIFNGKKGKESWISERQRDSVCERQSIAIGEK
jgi:hypothetical protein